jgi:prolyl-tRNA synthetase
MKDSYSFDLDDAGQERSYQLHREAYKRIFERLGLPAVPVSALAGAMGGSRSEEFLLPLEAGEDTFASCAQCGYAANVEAVVTRPAPESTDEHGPLIGLDTPDTPTIATLVARLNELETSGRVNWAAADTLKNVVVQVEAPGRAPELLAIGVPGDRGVDLKRLEAALHPARVSMFDDFASRPDLVKGYIGPQDIKLRYLVDPRVAPGTAWVTGANEPGRHAANVVCGRDFTPDGTIDVADVRAGDECPTCAAPLGLRRGVELGHIFQLGRRYADAFGLDALGPDGKPVRITMGSYGIGVSRLVAAIAETYADERGLAWPKSAAPVDVHLLAPGKDKVDAAAGLAADLERAGLRVLLDDRPGLSAGVRFADAELIGAPTAVVVGRAYERGDVEVRGRATGRHSEVSVARLVAELTG